MQTHILLLWCEMLDEDRKEQVEQKILQPPSDWVQIGSPFLSFYLYEVWGRLGKQQDILDSVRREWGMMLKHGSTTCWETFPGFHHNRLTRSYAHGWSAAPAYVFARHLLGVEMGSGKARSKVRLFLPDTDVKWAEGSLPTPYGRIDVYWEKDTNPSMFHVTVPPTVEIDSSDLPKHCQLVVERLQGS